MTLEYKGKQPSQPSQEEKQGPNSIEEGAHTSDGMGDGDGQTAQQSLLKQIPNPLEIMGLGDIDRESDGCDGTNPSHSSPTDTEDEVCTWRL